MQSPQKWRLPKKFAFLPAYDERFLSCNYPSCKYPLPIAADHHKINDFSLFGNICVSLWLLMGLFSIVMDKVGADLNGPWLKKGL